MARVVGVVLTLWLPMSKALYCPSCFGVARGFSLLSGVAGKLASIPSAETASSSVVVVPTTPISGMKPGTSGLRKKVEVWQGNHYLENFIQSLLNVAKHKNGDQMLDT
jgi:hypothetical protein